MIYFINHLVKYLIFLINRTPEYFDPANRKTLKHLTEVINDEIIL